MVFLVDCTKSTIENCDAIVGGRWDTNTYLWVKVSLIDGAVVVVAVQSVRLDGSPSPAEVVPAAGGGVVALRGEDVVETLDGDGDHRVDGDGQEGLDEG